MNWIKQLFKENHSESLTSLESICFLLVSLILILLPIYVRYIPPFMIFWGIVWLYANRNKLFVSAYHDKSLKYLFMFFIAFYLWEGIGIFYSNDIGRGVNVWLSRLSLLFFPLVLSKPAKKIIDNNTRLLKIFSLSTTAAILICYIYALYRSISISNGDFIFNPHPQKEYWFNYFYESYFAINQHPSYLSMYVLMSVFISLESYFDRSLILIKRILWLLNSLLLSTSVYFLSSRFGFVALTILVPVYIVFKSYKNSSLIKWFAIAMFIGILILIIGTNSRLRTNINEISENSFLQKDGRLLIWSAALQPIRHNLTFGVGIGDVKSELQKEYNLRGEKNFADYSYNVHNQYLEIVLECGIIGLILFLIILFLMFCIAILKRNILYLIFVIIMSIFFLFETVINRLQGVSFFPLFSFLLIYYKSPDNLKKTG